MRRPVIAGNWKMFKTTEEARELMTALLPLVDQNSDRDVIVAPVFTVLASAHTILADSPIHLAAQDCFWETEGAFTGEVSPKFLIDAGCTHVIIGHSERRQYFGETNETVNKKLKAALFAGLVPLFCLGETLDQRDRGVTFDTIRQQLSEGLSGISEKDVAGIIVAYEPVWAIGTGKTATEEQAQEVHQFIRRYLGDTYGKDVADRTRIVYGGSVKPDNINGLMSQPDIDGALVGGASLKADSFGAIANYGG